MIRPRARGEYIGSVSAVDQASALKDPIKEFQLDGSEAIRLLVCPGEKSTEPSKCRPCVFLSRLETEVRSTALPRIRFHVIRHSHATHILASGVP